MSEQATIPTEHEVIASWFHNPSFSHAATREEAANILVDLLKENGYLIVKKPKRAVHLTFEERNAAIRAYNSRAKQELSRAEMVDALIEAINTERNT